MNRKIKRMAFAYVALSAAAIIPVAQGAKSDGPPRGVLPPNFLHPVGDAKASLFTVVSAGGVVTATSRQIAAASPSIFTASANGEGVAAAIFMRRLASGTDVFDPMFRLDTATNQFVPNSVDPGAETDQSVLMLFGTGIRGGAQTMVGIGGVDAPMLFAGPQGANGLDQISVRVPRTLKRRGPVDVAVTTDRKAANIVRISFR